MKKIRYILLLSLFIVALGSYAQENIEKDSANIPKKEIDGQLYYLYKVQKGNTLYELSKYFHVSLKVLYSANPKVKESGLKIGHTLKIPVKQKMYSSKKDSSGSEDIFGDNYIFHKVLVDETLYSISKSYKINIKDIVAANPGSDSSITLGEILRLPIAKIHKENNPELEPTQSKYKTHNVEKQETLYSISKKYNVSITAILKVNDGLKEGLKAGTDINLPILKKKGENGKGKDKFKQLESAVQKGEVFSNDSVSVAIEPTPRYSLILDTVLKNKKDSYNINLMLPFFVQKNKEWQEKQNASSASETYSKSKVALNFYYGFKLGLDSFYNTNNDSSAYINVQVIDIAKDTKKIEDFCKSEAFQNADLNIGPLYLTSLKIAAKYALKYQKPLVVPVQQNSRLVLNNPYLQLAITPTVSQMRQLAHYTVDSLPGSNVVVISYTDKNDSLWANTFMNEFSKYASSKKDSAIFHKPKKLSLSNNGFIKKIHSLLRKDTTNIIVLPTNNKIFITTFFNRLNALSSRYNITVMGLKGWLDYTNIDPSFLQNAHLTIACSAFTNAEDSLTIQIKKSYVKKFKTYPDYYSFVGWGLAQYYATMLNKYGAGFLDFAEEEKMKFPFYHINFLKTGSDSGLINTGAVVIQLKDYHYYIVY